MVVMGHETVARTAWRATETPTADNTATTTARAQALVPLLGGVALSALLATLLFVLRTGRERARRQLVQRTSELHHQALHDALTGLPNRTLVMDRIDRMLARDLRNQTSSALLFLDIDNFKGVNNTLGHAAGDLLLIRVTERLNNTLRGVDTIGRMGGDEFVVLIDGTELDVTPTLVAQRLLDVMRQPFGLGEGTQPLSVNISIGIAAGPRERAPDTSSAMPASRSPRPRPRARTASSCSTRTCRATSPVAILEQTGQIREVGQWVLRTACAQMAAWHAQGEDGLSVSVNVSARQLDSDGIVEDIREALLESGLPAERLIVEITETALMANVESTARRLQAVSELGVKIAVDDFGAGYSSLAYLQQFPVDCLKIDRVFTSAVTSSPESQALVGTLVQLGKDLGLTTLAEGVETAEEMHLVREADVNQAQGFLMARPLDRQTLETQLLGPGSRD